MTSNEMLTTYESLSELTGTMLSAARQGEWDNLAALEERCRGYVGSLMQAAPVKLNETEQRTKVHDAGQYRSFRRFRSAHKAPPLPQVSPGRCR